MTVEYLVSEINKGRQLIFDLDDTIYPEKEFLFRVYKKISKLSKKYDSYLIFNYLKKTFLDQGRKNLFNKLQKKFPQDKFTVENCLSIMRSYNCDKCIDPYRWFDIFLSKMKEDFILKIITNGSPLQQQNKIKSIKIKWPKDLIEIIYASNYKPKPSISSFYQLKCVEKFISPIYIGNSKVDAEFCKNLNIEFFNVKNL